jgi:hypothetical protein
MAMVRRTRRGSWRQFGLPEARTRARFYEKLRAFGDLIDLRIADMKAAAASRHGG